MSLYAQLSEKALASKSILKYHKLHCVATAFAYKAAYALKSDNDKEALRLLQESLRFEVNIIKKRGKFASAQQNDTAFLSYDILLADSVKSFFIRAMTLAMRQTA